jgi:hypothetical protein
MSQTPGWPRSLGDAGAFDYAQLAVGFTSGMCHWHVLLAAR